MILVKKIEQVENNSLLINSMGDIPQKLETDVPSSYVTCAFEDNS